MYYFLVLVHMDIVSKQNKCNIYYHHNYVLVHMDIVSKQNINERDRKYLEVLVHMDIVSKQNLKINYYLINFINEFIKKLPGLSSFFR